MEEFVHGVVRHELSERRDDYLYRVSLKCVIKNQRGEVLVVKEAGRHDWDLPGGGMDHGESLKAAIAREMHEETNLEGDFTYQIIAVEEPKHLDGLNFWQIRLIFVLKPQVMDFSPGDDGDEIAFKHPQLFKNSASRVERRVYQYGTL